MNDFTARLNAAPTHLAYFTRGGGRALITQTRGEVVKELENGIIIRSAAIPNGATEGALIAVPSEDIVLRKDNGERITDAEWDAIFSPTGRGAEQKGF